MMSVCVLILPVCFTRPHGVFLVLYRVTNHMAGAPPLTERNWYIYIHIYAPASLLPLPPPGHGHCLPPALSVDLWCVWIGVNAG